MEINNTITKYKNITIIEYVNITSTCESEIVTIYNDSDKVRQQMFEIKYLREELNEYVLLNSTDYPKQLRNNLSICRNKLIEYKDIITYIKKRSTID